MNVIKTLVTQDEDKAIDAIDIIDELIESEMSIITPHLQPLVMFCLEITNNKELSDPLRMKALNTIGWLIRCKKKVKNENK